MMRFQLILYVAAWCWLMGLIHHSVNEIADTHTIGLQPVWSYARGLPTVVHPGGD
jgi:hypothetical protein